MYKKIVVETNDGRMLIGNPTKLFSVVQYCLIIYPMLPNKILANLMRSYGGMHYLQRILNVGISNKKVRNWLSYERKD